MSSAVVVDAFKDAEEGRTATAERELVDLLRQVGHGDRTAFRRIYDGYAPRLFSILVGLVKGRAFAEDLLRDVFVAIWQEAWQFDADNSCATAWLVSLTRRKCALALLQARGNDRPLEIASTLAANHGSVNAD